MTERYPRSDKALELRETLGLSRAEAAEHMQTNVRNIDALVCQARKRRDQERLKAAALATAMGPNV